MNNMCIVRNKESHELSQSEILRNRITGPSFNFNSKVRSVIRWNDVRGCRSAKDILPDLCCGFQESMRALKRNCACDCDLSLVKVEPNV